MFELNLLRDKAGGILLIRRLYSLLKVIYFISFIVLLIFVIRFMSLTNRIKNYQQENISLQKEIDQDKAVYGISGLEAEWRQNYSQMLLVEKIIAARTNLTPRVYEIARLMPEGAFLVTFAGRSDDTGIALDVRVNSNSTDRRGFELMNSLMGSLSRSSLFGKNVKLHSQERVSKEAEIFKISVGKMVKK